MDFGPIFSTFRRESVKHPAKKERMAAFFVTFVFCFSKQPNPSIQQQNMINYENILFGHIDRNAQFATKPLICHLFIKSRTVLVSIFEARDNCEIENF